MAHGCLVDCPANTKMLACPAYSISQKNYDTYSQTKNWRRNPNLLYLMGKSAVCMTLTDQGIGHLQEAASLGHLKAAFLMGLYHQTNKSLCSSTLTSDPHHYDMAVEYFKEAVRMIQHVQPANGANGLHINNTYIYVQVYARLLDLYFLKYEQSVRLIEYPDYNAYLLKENPLSTSQTLAQLKNKQPLTLLKEMKTQAQQCLNQPAGKPNQWSLDQKSTYTSYRSRCKQYLKWAAAAQPIEQKRISHVKACKQPNVNQCPDYVLINQQIFADSAGNRFYQPGNPKAVNHQSLSPSYYIPLF